jgi:hypothetical protein
VITSKLSNWGRIGSRGSIRWKIEEEKWKKEGKKLIFELREKRCYTLGVVTAFLVAKMELKLLNFDYVPRLEEKCSDQFLCNLLTSQ